MKDMNDNNKILGFMIQLLGFSLVWFPLKQLYWITHTTQFKIGNWVYSEYPPLWTLGYVGLFILGVLIIAYGVFVFKKSYGTVVNSELEGKSTEVNQEV